MAMTFDNRYLFLCNDLNHFVEMDPFSGMKLNYFNFKNIEKLVVTPDNKFLVIYHLKKTFCI